MTLAYRVANGATWHDSPDITATWVPFPNVNFPLSPPVFTLQVTPLQKLRTPSCSVDRRRSSLTGWRIIFLRLSPSAVLYCNAVFAIRPFLLSSLLRCPELKRIYVTSINSVDSMSSKPPAQSSSTLDPLVEGSPLPPAS